MAKEKEIEISYKERLKITKEIEAIEKKILDGVNIQAATRKKYNDLLDKSFTSGWVYVYITALLDQSNMRMHFSDLL